MVKKTIYFLPGTMCDQRLWREVFTYLPDDIDPIYIELPLGDDFDSIIAQLSSQLPDGPINLVGFSLGGYIAALFTLQSPERVDRLLISANSPSTLPLAEMVQRKIAISAVKYFGYQGLPASKISSMLATGNRDNQQIIATIEAMDRAGGATKLLSQLKATSRRKNLFPELVKLSVPVHFVYGDQDQLVAPDKISSICSALITSTILDNCGHMNPLEAPQRLAQEIAVFFN